MKTTAELLTEAEEALRQVWFVQSLEQMERTDPTLSLRLHIRPGLFVQAFLGELTGRIYFSLIESGRRIFGIDCEAGEWHRHPYDAPEQHEPIPEGMGPRPLFTFLAEVEELLLEHELL